MDGSRTQPPGGREWRRLRVWSLDQQGWRHRSIADALDMREETVSRWVARGRHGGPTALLAHRSPGRPPALSEDQLRLTPEFLWHGAEAYGFRGSVWTCGRVAKVIEEEFGVAFDKGHVPRLLKRLGWTPQMPVRRATQRDEAAIAAWRTSVWPRLLREAKTERRTPVFVGEAGLYLLPSVVRTYAPRAKTPVLRAKPTPDHLSVMGGMTPDGHAHTLVRQHALDGSHGVEFLTPLQRVAGRRPMVVWDGSPIHRRTIVGEFASQTNGRVRLEALPGYAPDLNPWDEGGWHHLKSVEMGNLTCRDTEELHEEFHLAVARLRRKPHLIRSYFAQAGLELPRT